MVADVAQTATESAVPTVTTKRTPYESLATAALCGLAMVLALVATWKGPGLSNDSVSYLSTGVNIAKSHGVVTLDDRPLTVFPPGLPVLVAAGEVVGLGVQTAARIVSVVSFGAMVLLGNLLLRRVLRGRRAVLAFTALLAVSPALFGISKMAWSEPPFIVVSLVFLLVLCRVWERKAVTRFDLVYLAVLCWLGFLLRYVGSSLIIAGGVTLLLALRPLDRRALARIVAFGALAVSVPILWMLRNHARDGTFLGPRSASPDSLWDVTERTAAVIGQWTVPWPDMSMGASALVGLAVVALIAAALSRIDWPRGRAAAVLACCCIFIPIYVALLTVSSLTTAINPTNSRFLSPIFVPLVVVGAGAASRVIAHREGVRLRNVLVALISVTLISYTFVSVRDARDGAADGIGLNADAIVHGDLSALAARTVGAADSRGVVLYSNNPNGLWSATGMQPIYFAPRDLGTRGAQISGELETFAARLACTSAPSYLVFYLLADDQYMPLRDIKAAVDVQPVANANSGVLFRVTAKPGAPCSSQGAHTVREP